jgi:NAD(P)-dependent dehydrogenase (short-subunit alcohol dehydrogenase family)
MAVKDLAGRLVVVTGGGSGIGQETALAFARAGANIVALDINEASLAETARLVEALGRRCTTFRCDITDPATVDTAAETVLRESGVPDILVNNAGIGFIGPFLETPLSAWQQVLGVNLMGIVHVTRAFLPAMLKAGGARHLVNVASAAGLHPVPHLSAYSASKHAVLGLSDTLAMELDATTIGVTVVCPGVINTPIVRNRGAVAASVPQSALDKLERVYNAKGIHPSVVGARIVRAVRRGEDIVLVEKSAVQVFHARRLSRRWLRKASIAGARKLGYVW